MLLIILSLLFLALLLVLLLIVGTFYWCKKNKAIVGRKPIFGTLSVAAPFIGGVLVYLLIWHANSFFVGLFMVPLSLICGATLAIVAWLRRERSRWLARIGLLRNSALLIAMVMIGCYYESPADIEFVRKVNDTKVYTSASKVKAAASPLYLKPGKDTDIPDEIRSLPFFKTEDNSEPNFIVNMFQNGKALVFLQYNSYASWGIIVCFGDGGLDLKDPMLRGTIIRWDDGVYFCADWRVKGADKKDIILRRE